MEIVIAAVIDQHRVAHNYVGQTGRTVECMCGHQSQVLYHDLFGPITDENNPERLTQRKHAGHVAQRVAEALSKEDVS